MIKTRHGEHKIQYDEESNLWLCKAMRCSAPSLGALRTKLNAEDREDRRITGVRVFCMDRAYGGEMEEVVVTMIDTNRHGVNGYRAGQNSKRRDYFSLGSLVVQSERNAPKIERYKRAATAYEAAEKELSAAREALPHPTVEELQKLSAKQPALAAQ